MIDNHDEPQKWGDSIREVDESTNQIVKDLEELIGLGLIEISGINEKGEWLYGITDKGREITRGLNDPSEVLDALFGEDGEFGNN